MSQYCCAAVSTNVMGYNIWPEGKKNDYAEFVHLCKRSEWHQNYYHFFCKKQVIIVIILNSRTNYKKISVKVRASILEIFSWLRQASTNSSLEIFPSVSVSISLNASLANSSGVV